MRSRVGFVLETAIAILLPMIRLQLHIHGHCRVDGQELLLQIPSIQLHLQLVETLQSLLIIRVETVLHKL